MTLLERLRSEVAYLRGAVRTLRAVRPIARDRGATVGDFVTALAARHGDRVALISDRETFTYREMNARANRYARWAKANGLGQGDAVALLMGNRPDYLCLWFGFAKLGAVTALLNTNLAGRALAHCMTAAGARAVVVEATLLPTLETALPHLPAPLPIFVHGAPDGAETTQPAVDRAMGDFSGDELGPAERPRLTSLDRCLYIYTSGTTGLPKAANLNHYRVQLAMRGFAGATGAGPNDCVYDCMPMFHTVGGVCAPGVALVNGGKLVIRDRFSAREFWADIVRHRCTIFCYIGEFCRYLLAAAPAPQERSHGLRLIFGNGLRPDVWVAFRDRFALPRILEFYAATESNVSMFNFDSRPGKVGRVPKWLERKFPFAVLRFDVETGQPSRGPDGFCIACAPDETGEVVGAILDDPSRPGARFEGYVDKAATERKVLRDVFAPGDRWFSTGDLMRRDALGYYEFVDRVGDTFRWKGENVSTTEVAEHITGFPGIAQVTVYGVAVPGAEGRAGMAALATDPAAPIDLAALHAYLATHLPEYARPRFLRFQDELEITSTFKQRKTTLVEDGFDPARTTDRLYFDDPRDGAFVLLTPQLYGEIASGRVRV